ncbi:hypothetical protein K435DRAFT_845436 [Dendrothele bispora CBS 962.96]|uniref:DUF6534 domain-containing protein n=1 Tax=Dendrothele bispora (strain CBS 962.96) TaxID=1314807 RepID=A0A4S8KUP5_DENBC|nr:hypothetical protein K435DRAFT_845436 [Dendrothele bispora CBS 962.96]
MTNTHSGCILGALEIGVMISGILFGIVTTQVYIYHKNFPNDALWLKIGLVDTIWLLEFAHTGCVLHALYHYTVTHYGDPGAIITAPVTLGYAALIHGIVTFMVQGFFTYRITRLTQKPYIIPILSTVLMLIHIVAMTIMSVKTIQKWEWLVIMTLALRVSADILVSGALVWYLWIQKENAYKPTLKIVDKLIKWAVETGVITRQHAWYCHSDKFIWLAWMSIFPKVFSNTLLANINSRAHLRDLRDSEIIVGSRSAHSAARTQTDTERSCGITITVTTRSDVEMDAFEIRHMQDGLEFRNIESRQGDHKEDEESEPRIGGHITKKREEVRDTDVGCSDNSILVPVNV